MGIDGLWPILEPACQTVTLQEYSVQKGFLANINSSRILHVGIDASTIMAGYTYNSNAHAHTHATADGPLVQMWRLLNQLSRATVDATFVYDGKNRPEKKRGRTVVHQEPLYQKKCKQLVEAFGYRNHTAPGEAEAELCKMNQRGVIEAIVTIDSDVFPGGAKHVMRINSKKSTDTQLVVDIFDAAHIQETLGLSHAGLILIAGLTGNDLHDGLDGCGIETSRQLAQAGFAEGLIQDYRLSKLSSSRFHDRMDKLRLDIAKELRTKKRTPGNKNEKLARHILGQSELIPISVLRHFIEPVSSWSEGHQQPDVSRWLPQLHDMNAILKFCKEHMGWEDDYVLKRWHSELYAGVIIRMLSSKYLGYEEATGKITVLILGKNGARQTQIIGPNPPNLTNAGPARRLTFSVAGIVDTPLEHKDKVTVTVPTPLITDMVNRFTRGRNPPSRSKVKASKVKSKVGALKFKASKFKSKVGASKAKANASKARPQPKKRKDRITEILDLTEDEDTPRVIPVKDSGEVVELTDSENDV